MIRELQTSVARLDDEVIRLRALNAELLAALKECNRGDAFSDASIILEQKGYPDLAKALRRIRDAQMSAAFKADQS